MTPWVKRLLIANVVVWLATLVYPALRFEFALWPAMALREPWTLVTYAFLHAGMAHLLFNMLGLFFFGPRLEYQLGSRDFVRLYVVSGITGGLLSALPYIALQIIAWVTSTPYQPPLGGAHVVGASGAVLGVLLGFARYWPNETILLFGIIPIPARGLVIGFAVFSVLAGVFGLAGGIAHAAHLGGLLGAWLFLRWRDGRRRRRWNPAPPTAEPTRQTRQAVTEDRAARWAKIQVEELHEINRHEVERIMRKLGTHGASSLSRDEVAFMDRMSQGWEQP